MGARMNIVESTVERLRQNKAAEAAREQPSRRMVNTDESAAEFARPLTPPSVRWTGRQPAALVDLHRLRHMQLYPPAEFAERIQNEYRGIRRQVVAASLKSGPIVVVTSALAGEGKSFSALNLALSIAGQDVHDILLVDADTIKPTISGACDLQERPGVMELLSEPQANVMDYVSPTNVRRLHILPAGIRPEAASDLFSIGRLGPLFESIRSKLSGHLVIVDTPPILLSSDASALTDVAGLVLLVVRAGCTPQDSVKEALTAIRDSIPVGVVLNA